MGYGAILLIVKQTLPLSPVRGDTLIEKACPIMSPGFGAIFGKNRAKTITEISLKSNNIPAMMIIYFFELGAL